VQAQMQVQVQVQVQAQVQARAIFMDASGRRHACIPCFQTLRQISSHKK